jgi:phosphoglycerate dehydrogenase-like enzyme
MPERRLEGTVVVLAHRNAVQDRLAEMQTLAGDAEVIFCATREELADRIPQAEVVAGGVPRALFPAARCLRWIHSWGTGVNGALHPELVASDVVMTCASGNASHPIAEHGILLMLMLQQQTVRVLQQQRDHHWQQIVHPELYGKTVGVIGLGDIGLEVVRRARAFHMRVLGMRRSAAPCAEVDELYPRDRLLDLLAASDFVVMAAPMTPATAKMLGEAEFRAMKPTAYFINISRGGCVDEAALARAMQEGWIAGAGIDQPTLKPLPADSPLWDLPNTILTPAYGGHTPEVYQRGVDIFVNNLRRYVAGEPLHNVVDKHAGY